MPRVWWRVFPWDPDAAAGAPFSAEHRPVQSGQGRFDLPATAGASSWYLAESPEHAVAEKLQDLRNQTLVDAFLFERGHRLALCSVQPAGGVPLADLCDPHELARRDIAPDRLAYRDRGVTRDIAKGLHADTELAGFRWWSALFGEWHTVVLFSDRLPRARFRHSIPEPLGLTDAPVRAAALALGIEIDPPASRRGGR